MSKFSSCFSALEFVIHNEADDARKDFEGMVDKNMSKEELYQAFTSHMLHHLYILCLVIEKKRFLTDKEIESYIQKFVDEFEFDEDDEEESDNEEE